MQLISIIIPCFNEEDSIVETLADVNRHLPDSVEVLVVDGGNDRTRERVAVLAEDMPMVRYIFNDNDRGKGHAIRTGISEAKGTIHVQFDGDGQFFAEDIRYLIQPILDGRADVVLGSRFMRSSPVSGNASVVRTLGNKAISLVGSLLFGQRITDALAGIKAWTADYAQAHPPQFDGFEYEVEISVRALLAGRRVVEAPVSTRERQAGQTKVSEVRTGLRILTAMWRLRWGA